VRLRPAHHVLSINHPACTFGELKRLLLFVVLAIAVMGLSSDYNKGFWPKNQARLEQPQPGATGNE
jgi:hypothetical protein